MGNRAQRRAEEKSLNKNNAGNVVSAVSTNNNNVSMKEDTMSTVSQEIANAKSVLTESKENAKAIKAVKFEIEAIELAMKLRIKSANKASDTSLSATQREAITMDFNEGLMEQKLLLEELTKRDALFTADNMDAFGITVADKLADMVEKTPINSGLSMVAQLKNRLKKESK